MAGITGFEPIQTESKSVVLPLHYIPMCKKSIEKECCTLHRQDSNHQVGGLEPLFTFPSTPLMDIDFFIVHM